MRHLKRIRLVTTVALSLVGFLFYSHVRAIAVTSTPASYCTVSRMWPVFSYYDDDDYDYDSSDYDYDDGRTFDDGRRQTMNGPLFGFGGGDWVRFRRDR